MHFQFSREASIISFFVVGMGYKGNRYPYSFSVFLPGEGCQNTGKLSRDSLGNRVSESKLSISMPENTKDEALKRGLFSHF